VIPPVYLDGEGGPGEGGGEGDGESGFDLKYLAGEGGPGEGGGEGEGESGYDLSVHLRYSNEPLTLFRSSPIIGMLRTCVVILLLLLCKCCVDIVESI
jgi:hypothetical protein